MVQIHLLRHISVHVLQDSLVLSVRLISMIAAGLSPPVSTIISVVFKMQAWSYTPLEITPY